MEAFNAHGVAFARTLRPLYGNERKYIGVLKMSYDVIETLIATKKKEMQPASIVQLEGDIQFTKYLPSSL